MYGLSRQPGSHLQASLREWLWPTSWGEVADVALAEAILNGFKGKSDKPIVFPKPWDEVQHEEPVSDEDRARLKKELAARSAFD